MDNDFEIIELDDNSESKGVSDDAFAFSCYKNVFKRSVGNYFNSFLLFLLLILFEETVFHIWAFKKIDLFFVLKVLLCFPIASLFSLFVSFLKNTISKVFTSILYVLIQIYFIVHILYHSIFKVFFSVEFLDKNNVKIFQYYREIAKGIADNALVLIISFCIPLAIYVLLTFFNVLRFDKVSLKCIYFPLLFLIFSLAVSVLVIPLYGKDEFSPYEMFYKENDSDYSFKELGVLASNAVQLKNVFYKPVDVYDDDFDIWVNDYVYDDVSDNISDNNHEDVSASDISSDDVSSDNMETEEIVKEIDRSPNILNIDFASLAENEEDENLAAIDRFMASLEPTNKNEYTGMFKGFNLIFMTAEGFSNIAVDEIHTPTLYRLTHEGFVFNNFYNPRTGGSTSDGEFVNCTSLFPTYGGAKNFKIAGQKAMPFSLGNIFNRTYGITSRAYHNNDYEYYGRDITYPGMGYYYEGVGNGVEVSNHWPESDLEMMQDTVDDYIDDDLFNVYYMTVSGHLNYSFNGNYYSSYHREEVADLPYSEAGRAYIACQMEFDKALEYLINRLEEKGIADKTVICFTGDHWPYGLNNSQFSEVLGHEVEETFELYKSNLVLWSEAIEEPIVIDKYCCSYDILPTLLNLFGFDYDSRLFVGRDILSDSEGFVPMWDKSIITDRFMYDSHSKEVTLLTDEPVSDDDIAYYKKLRSNKWKYSSLIMETDYYKYLDDYLGITIEIPEQNYTVDYSKFTP